MGAMQTAFDFGHLGGTPQALANRLGRLLDRPLSLVITDNGRVMVSSRREGAELRLRLHRMFLGADKTVVDALARFLRDDCSEAAASIRNYVSRKRGTIRPRERRLAVVDPRGRRHELDALLQKVVSEHFVGAEGVRITWGRRTQGPRGGRRSIKLGSYSIKEQLIRIHPVLDDAWVPPLFVEYIIFHELVHHELGVRTRAGRRNFHDQEFRRRERSFPGHAAALAWERENLRRLLRS
jgi:hypothetical protein